MFAQSPLLLQCFEWHTNSSPSSSQYSRVNRLISTLSNLGITSLWLPPGCKANNPNGNGYDIYDLWDLGEFEQKGTRATKWGSREELDELIRNAKEAGVEIVWDAVLNHKTGGDATAEAWAVEVDKEDRHYEICPPKRIEAWLQFDFLGRYQEDGELKHSQFKWRTDHFNGVDWDHRERKNAVYKLIDDPATLSKPFAQPKRPRIRKQRTSSGGRFSTLIRRFSSESKTITMADPARRPGKGWADDVDKEHGNNDYLMFSNIDYTHPDVRGDTSRWGEWMVSDIGVDGFRLDAVQHFSFNFTKDWIQSINSAYRRRTNGLKDIFVVGEVWSGDLSRIKTWLNAVQHPSGHPQTYAYDAPLLYNFSRISKDISNQSRNIDLRTILRNSLLESRPEAALTLVTNHDTQPGQTMATSMPRELKLLWYAFILLRKEGMPCVFWGDLFGTRGPHAEPAIGTKDNEDQHNEPRRISRPLAKLMLCRKHLAYGRQRDYLDSAWTVGWTRDGEEGKDGSGCAVILNVAPLSKTKVTKKMQIGQPLDVWIDVLDPERQELTIDAKGFGAFPIRGPGVSVFAKKGSEKFLVLPKGLDANVYDI